jgi:hypothetical protein
MRAKQEEGEARKVCVFAAAAVHHGRNLLKNYRTMLLSSPHVRSRVCGRGAGRGWNWYLFRAKLKFITASMTLVSDEHQKVFIMLRVLQHKS